MRFLEYVHAFCEACRAMFMAAMVKQIVRESRCARQGAPCKLLWYRSSSECTSTRIGCQHSDAFAARHAASDSHVMPSCDSQIHKTQQPVATVNCNCTQPLQSLPLCAKRVQTIKRPCAESCSLDCAILHPELRHIAQTRQASARVIQDKPQSVRLPSACVFCNAIRHTAITRH